MCEAEFDTLLKEVNLEGLALLLFVFNKTDRFRRVVTLLIEMVYKNENDFGYAIREFESAIEVL